MASSMRHNQPVDNFALWPRLPGCRRGAEGFDTRDLKEAKALLEELAS